MYIGVFIITFFNREDGLMWVLQKLQEIGEDVTILDFADFLDARTRRFLLDVIRFEIFQEIIIIFV